jgi:CelD/BcsL family acetyltransferase involved in cellulose biosynthesis
VAERRTIPSWDAAPFHDLPAAGIRPEPREWTFQDVTTEVVTSLERLAALGAEFEYLHRVCGNTLPFALHEWQLAWCDHYLRRKRIAVEPFFCVVRSRSGECVAIVPLLVKRRSIGPLKLVSLGFTGTDPGLTEIRTPLVKPGYERATVRAVQDSLAQVPDWDWINWSALHLPMAAALAEEVRPQSVETSEAFLLDLPSSWSEFRGGLSRNAREALRHSYNSLRRDQHAFEFRVARETSELQPALARFLRLHALRAAMPWGPRHPDRFATAQARTFLYDVCHRLAARDAVRVFQLSIAGQIVSSRVGFVLAGSLYLYYSGFDPAWARYSVMNTTTAEALRYAIANGIKTVNLSLYRERSKMRWRPRQETMYSVLVNRERLSSRMGSTAYNLIRSRSAELIKGLFWPRGGGN